MAIAGNAQDDPLEGRSDGARVGHVVAQVRPVVDARDDQVRLLAQESEVGEANAVHWRAIGRKSLVAVVELDLLDPERRAGRDAPRGRRAVRVGRDEMHLHPVELAERAAERLDALGADSVVVGDQDPHTGRVYEPPLHLTEAGAAWRGYLRPRVSPSRRFGRERPCRPIPRGRPRRREARARAGASGPRARSPRSGTSPILP